MAKQSKTNKKKAYDMITLYQSLKNSHWEKWREWHQECYDFYLNDQIDADTKDELRSAGMPDFIINMIIPAVELMKYFLTANNPRWQAVGREGSDSEIASVFGAISQYIWHISSGKSGLGLGIVDVVVKSKLYWHVIVDPDADQGQGEVMITTEDPFNVLESPDGMDIFGRDSGAKMIHKVATRQALMDKLPKYADKIKRASSGPSMEAYSERDYDDSPTIQYEDITTGYDTETGAVSDMLDYFEKYRKVRVPYVRLVTSIPPSMEDIQQINQYVEMEIKELTESLSVELKELEVKLAEAVKSGDMIPERAEYEFNRAQKEMERMIEERKVFLYSKARDESTKVEVHNIRKEEYEAIKDTEQIKEFIVSATEYFETRIERSCAVGNQLLYEYILPDPICEYPLFSIPAIYTGTAYPMSFIIPAIGKQKEINRAHQIMIHNANLGSNLRALIQEGQVDDDLWDKYMSSPGARLYWRNLGDGTKPEFILPLPLSNAFYEVVNKGQSDFEYLVGMRGASMGEIQEQAETYRGMLANDEFSTRRLRGWVINIFEPGMELLGQIVSQFAQATYSIHKVFRIVQPNADTGETQSMDAEINIPLYNDLGEQIGRFNDLQAARYDVVYIAGSTMPVNRWALLEEYFRWFQAGLIDDIEFIQHTDIQDKEGVVKRNSLYAKLKNEIESMREMIKNKDGDIETLSRQVLQLSIRAKEAGLITEMRKDVLDNEAKQAVLADKFKNEIDFQKKIVKEKTEQFKKNLDNSKK